MKDTMPPQVYDAIQRHLLLRGNQAHRAWESASEDEDSLTGDFGRTMATPWVDRAVNVNGETWYWRVGYKKFRGRGPGAFESHSGADGIFQIEVSRADGGSVHHKGILFQAKTQKLGFGSQLISQVTTMEEIAPKGSAVFEFGPEGYRAIRGGEYLEELGNHRRLPRDVVQPIGGFLADEFLPCEAGVRGMYYDGMRRQLLVPSPKGPLRSYRFDVGHRIRVDVVSQPR